MAVHARSDVAFPAALIVVVAVAEVGVPVVQVVGVPGVRHADVATALSVRVGMFGVG
ncbi:MAG: hypothetical protein FJ029_13440 [Actinobacteria bacterium]|nr:hypothetical protein [Actinomycetota bacterium]